MPDMEAQHEIERWRYDPFVPLNWRFQDATNLAADKRMKWAHADDSLVGDCAAYLQAVDSATTGRERVAVRARWPLIHAASELANDTGLRRVEIQARLLAGQTDEQIAERCRVQPEVVACFEKLYFSVRHRLRAIDNLMKHAIGPGIHQGFGNNEVAQFFGWCALAAGPIAVDLMVERLRDVLRPGEQPTLAAYFRRRVPLAVQGFVAAHTLPFTEQMAGVWTECHSRLKKTKGSDAAVENSDIERRVLIRLAKAHLAGLPLPIKPLTTAPKSSRPAKGSRNQEQPASNTKPRRFPPPGDLKRVLVEMGLGAE